MNEYVHATCKWCYSGSWRVLTACFKVPRQPPSLPSSDPALVRAFRPSENYLRYLKLFFWIGCVLIDLALAIIWIAIAVVEPLIGALITPLMLFSMIVPDVVSYLAIHLKYDTTWYVVSDRSVRIRRGIWIIRETTITFENVQNIRLNQGPLERYFGFANLVVDTAGGGSASPEEIGAGNAHHGTIRGIANAEELRDRIMAHVRCCRSAGLGDERRDMSATNYINFSATDLGILAEIRDQTVLLARKR